MAESIESIKPKLTDMSVDLLRDSRQLILENMKRYSNEKDIAYHIKRDMDRKYGGPWHCIVGRNFGLYVTHEEGYYLQALKGQMTIVIWK